MPIPNGGLINETNSQYYAGTQQFITDSTASIGQSFTSTFDTNLIVGTGKYSDPATSGYNLNNFKVFTSPNAQVWAELTPSSAVASTNGTAAAPGATNQKNITLNAVNASILVGMTVLKADGTLIGVVESIAGAVVTCVANITTVLVVGDIITFRFAEPWAMANNVVTIIANLPASTYVQIELSENAKENNFGSYEYTRLYDIIDNFLIAYVGEGKLITSVKRSDVIFHARRGLQEFSYDTLKSIKSSELTVPSSLSLTIPQDYVNYVKLSWVDELGVLHTIYPTNNLNQSPYYTFSQDDLGNPIQDNNANNTEVTSQMNPVWSKTNPRRISGGFINELNNANAVFDRSVYDGALGQRYGLEPQTSQKNGWFKIDERKGTFNFTSNLANRLILLQYISDGNAYDLDTRIPKLAEEALYSYIIYALLSTSTGIQEYIVRRFQKEKSAKLRNAKIRLSNIKLDQIIQVMRGKSKWIK